MQKVIIPKILFVIYKLDNILEREPEFLNYFKELQDSRDIKILFTIENFQTFWEKNDPEVLNTLKINYMFMVHWNIQTYELEGSNYGFNENQDEKAYNTFIAVYSAFDDKLKDFLFETLLFFKEKECKSLKLTKVYQNLYRSLIVSSKKQFNTFMKEPESHKILENKDDMVSHNYSMENLNKIIYSMIIYDPSDRYQELIDKYYEDFKPFINKIKNLNEKTIPKNKMSNSSNLEENMKCYDYSNDDDDEENEDEDENENDENENENVDESKSNSLRDDFYYW